MKEKHSSALHSNMDTLISGLEEFIPFEFKSNFHCFYGMKYWRNC